jgi:hypothetical protein
MEKALPKDEKMQEKILKEKQKVLSVFCKDILLEIAHNAVGFGEAVIISRGI